MPGFSNGEKVWDGFPYVSDQEFGQDLKKLMDPVLQREASPETSYILMTHIGPNCSCELIIHAYMCVYNAYSLRLFLIPCIM